jgi:hypothetical protein
MPGLLEGQLTDRSYDGNDPFLFCHLFKFLINKSKCLKGTFCLSLIMMFAIALQD